MFGKLNALSKSKSNSKVRKSTSSAVAHATMQPLEDRRMFNAVADKVVDVTGPVQEMVEAGGQIYISVPLASGGSTVRIYGTDGRADHTKLLLDATQPGMNISAIEELTATEDGRIFFTASTTGGKHLFELTPHDGKLYKLTDGTSKFYTNVTAAGDRVYVQEGNSDTIYTIAPGSRVLDTVVTMNVDTDFQAAGTSVFFIGPNEELWRSDGTAAGTVKVSGDYRVTRGDFFTGNEIVVFEGNKDGENTSLFIVGLDGTVPQKVADDFSLFNSQHAELAGWVYFSGGFYNTSPNANGRQLYRVNTAGTVELASKVEDGGQVEGISAIGNYVYFTANDGEHLPSQGMGDRELYKLNTLTGQTKLITDDQLHYPTEIGKGVLSSYYFVAAPDKENARFGSRALYRTNPVTDEIEEVEGLPTVKDLNGNPYQRVREVGVGANGFFFVADTGDNGRERDVFFSHAPFSLLDPATKIVTITGTDFADETLLKVEGGELVITQNGYEERHSLASVERIEAYLKKGNDVFFSDANVTIATYCIGDEGNDRITTGSGNDTLTGGAGLNRLWGGEGDDRFVGAPGRDIMAGEGGDDRFISSAGNDLILCGHGSDWVDAGAGDDLIFGSLGADRIYAGAGNDKVYGQLSADLIDLGEGDDWADGAEGDDTITGGAGIDAIYGGLGDDVLFSNDGERDHVGGGDGNDTLTKDLEEESVDLVEVIL